MKRFADSFDPLYVEKLDPGEVESLAYLENVTDDACRICSADAIVFRVLGNLDRSEQGVSLEEVLATIGLSRKLDWQFTKRFRERWTREGAMESLQGRGRRRVNGAD